MQAALKVMLPMKTTTDTIGIMTLFDRVNSWPQNIFFKISPSANPCR